MIEASHFDPAVAYAAVDRHRLDDQKPYLYRTRDYGKTWQSIADGIGEHYFLNTIREDPQKRGLLFAGTELGIYVSFDDGDHWQPLQLNLPASSVRDMNIHNDDLIIATHGRSFWILDDTTALRQVNEQTSTALYKPAPAVRVDNDLFLGSPLPPEEPTAKNPPDGAILDYYLNAPAKQVTLEIFDPNNKLVRRYISGGPKEQKRPPLPIAPRWLPMPQVLEVTPGMHRFVWDLRWRVSDAFADLDDEGGFGIPQGPRAVPGNYEVKLTVDGQNFTQPLKVQMDPRSSATPAVLAEQFRLGLEMFGEARKGRQTAAEIASIRKKLDELKPQLEGKPALLSRVTAIEAAITKLEKGTDNAIGAITGLQTANTGLGSSLRVVESGDRAVPSQALEVYHQADQAMKARVLDWQSLKSSQLAQLNQALQQAGLSPLQIAGIEREDDAQMAQ
jgi:hypothetical protein